MRFSADVPDDPTGPHPKSHHDGSSPQAATRTPASPPKFNADAYDFLDEIPTTVRGNPNHNSRDLLASAPSMVEGLDDIFTEYPAGSGEDDGTSLSARVPNHWLDAIDIIRQMPGTNFPDIFKTRSRFVRWCIAVGIKSMVRMADELNEEGRLEAPLDPTLRARIFMENQAGRLAARSDAINMAREQVESIAGAVSNCIEFGEITEAADLVNSWIQGARDKQSPFWQNYLCSLIVSNDVLKDSVRKLVVEGHITDEYVIDLAEHAGLLDVRPESA